MHTLPCRVLCASVSSAWSSGGGGGGDVFVTPSSHCRGCFLSGTEMAAGVSEHSYTATVDVGPAGIIQYKFVVVNAAGDAFWEVGSNRCVTLIVHVVLSSCDNVPSHTHTHCHCPLVNPSMRNITQDEIVDCGVFHTVCVCACVWRALHVSSRSSLCPAVPTPARVAGQQAASEGKHSRPPPVL